MDLLVRPLSNLRGLSMPYRRAAICSDLSASYAAFGSIRWPRTGRHLVRPTI